MLIKFLVAIVNVSFEELALIEQEIWTSQKDKKNSRKIKSIDK